MLKEEIKDIIKHSKLWGWVLEPDAKRIISSIGLEVPRYIYTKDLEQAIHFVGEIGYPVVAKVVSPKIIHKSEKKGVEVGIKDDKGLRKVFNRFYKMEGFSGILVEQMFRGLELIIGAKNDYQFGPVILFGLGGIWTEIYRDIILKMAPLRPKDIDNMTKCLKARPILEGYRGAPKVNLEELNRLLNIFSDFVMEIENDFESIDLNPVICSTEKCIIADARIILKKGYS